MPDNDQLKFRLSCRNVAFTFEGVDLSPLFLTRESADAARLHGLIERLIEARAAPEPIFRLIERLAETGGAVEADRTVARFPDYSTDTLARVRAAYTALHHRQRHAGSSNPAPARTEVLPKLFRAPEDQTPSEQARLRLPVDVDPPTDLNEIRTMMRAMPITCVHLQAYGGREHKAAHHAVLGAHGYQYAFLKASRQVSNVVQGPLRWRARMAREGPRARNDVEV